MKNNTAMQLMMKPIIIIEGDNDSPGASLPTSSPLLLIPNEAAPDTAIKLK
jgi:hypothetical protein